MRTGFIHIILVLISFSAFSQTEKAPEDVKLYYRASSMFGAYAHTDGVGISYRYQQHLSYKLKRLYLFEFQSLKHPKQEKVFGFDENSGGYFFGKVNAFANLRVGIGTERSFAMKELKKGVQLSWVFGLGVNLGFMKPTYIEVVEQSKIVQRRYDPEIHSSNSIAGRGPRFAGFDDLSLIPGGFAKLGINFEYSSYDYKLKGVETGIALDVFYKEVPLMYYGYNNQHWVTFYVLFEIGNKIE